jgi:hypothetical protein
MNKGTTGIQNVRLLKWARYYGLRISWNVLLGFPGEREEDYAQQLATMKLIRHLQPPESASRIWLERFSPNFERSAELGFVNVRPEPAYAHVYPKHIEHERVAYFFSYDAPSTLPDEAYAETRAYVEEWRETWNSSNTPFLGYQRGAGRLVITDGRNPENPQMHLFGERAALVYEACALTPHGLPQVLETVRAQGGVDVSETTIGDDLATFCRLGMMLEEDGRYLSLALPANPNW